MTLRRKLRIAFWLLVVGTPLALLGADHLSQGQAATKAGIRVVTINVNTRPEQVAGALMGIEPDVVLMQETGGTCEAAAALLDLRWVDGSDQCVLSRWPMKSHSVAWPGPWQPPQLVTVESGSRRPLDVVNVHLAMPKVIAASLGKPWYTEAQRRDQFAALRRLLPDRSPVAACGDFNALPLEVHLGSPMRDAWSGFRYGATFPGLVPAARIDQCWVSPGLQVVATWIQAVPSDHRAVVMDVQMRPR
jgi:endonuclease/exonuclease/phosphatase family metal-dependent hydrolase